MKNSQEINKNVIFKADDFVRVYGKKIPLQEVNRAILCFSSSLAKKISEKYSSQRIFALGACFDIYKDFNTVIVSQFGFGSSSALLQLEHLRALGIKDFISFGLACSLCPQLKVAQGVFIEKAYNNLLDSSYYGEDKTYVTHSLDAEMKKKMEALNLVPSISWTSAIPYRETELKKILSYEVTCFEMEASALLSFANFYSLKMTCIAFISDFIDEKGKWNLCFSHHQLKEQTFLTLEKLLSS